MKRMFAIGCLLCLFCLPAVWGVEAQDAGAGSNPERDSIFRMLDAMPLDTLRYRTTVAQFQRYIQSDWSMELADREAADARALGGGELLLQAMHDRYRYAQYRLNMELMWTTLDDLKQVCYEYKQYARYFKSTRSALALCAANGNYEDALHRADRLEQEAKSVDYQMGVAYSMMGKADAYRFMEEYAKSRDLYLEVLNFDGLTDSDLLTIQGTLCSLYVAELDYQIALKHLAAMEEALKRLIERTPSQARTMWNNRSLEVQLNYILIYLATHETEKAKVHLDEGWKYYSSSTYIDYACKYHEYWANYYSLVHQWDDCLREMDWLLSVRGDKAQPVIWLALMEKKVEYLYAAGRTKEAVEEYAGLVSQADSINNDLLQRQEAVLAENRAIQQSLMRKEQLRTDLRLLYGICALAALVGLIIMMWRAWHIRQHISVARKETKAAMLEVQQDNKMKEVFLRNITKSINRPLSDVVRYAQLLAAEETLTADMKADYSVRIRQSAIGLLTLVNDILDLSRLEAGMMKFQVGEENLVSLCRDAVWETKFVEGNRAQATLASDVEEWKYLIDCIWFKRVLVTCMAALKADDETPPEVTCIVRTLADSLIIIIQHSPLARLVAGNDQNAFVKSEICRLFVETFHGTLRIGKDNTISITFFSEARRRRNEVRRKG
ncbi:MAG: histidine kinase dimerization/phospho-acceptor domain-containing protein [Bacteroides sp.]|nr:histidine kinase dimerization/phospho-acceptor domain-containing protein [Bacteroides sp.]